MRVFDAKPHLYCNNVSVEPWEQGPSAEGSRRDGLAPSRRSWDDDEDYIGIVLLK